MRGLVKLTRGGKKGLIRSDIPSALQIAPALLYFLKLKLTFSAQWGSLFGTIALVRGNPREQVSGGLLIKTRNLTAIGG